MVCPNVFAYHNTAIRDKLIDFFTEKISPYAYAKIIQVSNRVKKVNSYIIIYDKTKKVSDIIEIDSLCKRLPGINLIKILLKRAVERATIIDYKLDGNQNRKKKKY